VAQAIRARFDDLDYVFDVGELDLNISGCMNACGHHHVGHIGILGVDKAGAEFYQIEIGGNQGETRPGAAVALGTVLGRAFSADEVPDAIERLLRCYLDLRDGDAERFVDTVQRVGTEPFKEHLYGETDQEPQTRSRRLAVA
jgi:sulfite reductase (NADPH) hemoprotein beta-component